jgi:hypothetical protein
MEDGDEPSVIDNQEAAILTSSEKVIFRNCTDQAPQAFRARKQHNQ